MELEAKHQGEDKIDSEKALAMKDVPITRSPSFTNVYANSARIVAGFFDVKIMFGDLRLSSGPDQDKPLAVEELACVSMSWEHLAALKAIIDKKIEDYEKQHGPLRKRPKIVEVEA